MQVPWKQGRSLWKEARAAGRPDIFRNKTPPHWVRIHPGPRADHSWRKAATSLALPSVLSVPPPLLCTSSVAPARLPSGTHLWVPLALLKTSSRSLKPKIERYPTPPWRPSTRDCLPTGYTVVRRFLVEIFYTINVRENWQTSFPFPGEFQISQDSLSNCVCVLVNHKDLSIEKINLSGS